MSDKITTATDPTIAPDSGVRETAWTPGPWTARPRRRDPQQWSIDAHKGDPTLGHSRWDGLAVYGCDDMPKEGAAVAEANARLISAAPDLFAALDELLNALDVCRVAGSQKNINRSVAARQAACAAIAHATQQGADDAGR